MFEKAKSGWEIIGASIRAFAKFPQLLIPLLFSWIFYAGTIIYFNFVFDWKSLEDRAAFALCFGIIFGFSTLLCFSASWLLEMIEQIETGKPLNVGTALGETIGVNLLRMLPIAFLWATVWFALIVVDVLTSKRKSESEDQKELSFKNATEVLAGTIEQSSWSSLSIDMIQKLVRMLVFLSLPAVCWRGMFGFSAMGEGLRTARKHAVEFLAGYVLSGAAAALLFLPVALPAYLDAKKIIHVPAEAWPVMFVYLAFAWSFSIYIEQMFTAELYLWHMKWDKAVKHAQKNGAIEPKLSEIKRPSMVDETADLNDIQSGRPVATNKEYALRRTNEFLRSAGPAHFSCERCPHEYKFASFKELQFYDYDMDAANGIQLKCPDCGHVTTFTATKKHG
jgi:hypothetical protein